MLFNVIAEIEIEGTPIENYISLKIEQRFNEHHRFDIRLPYEVWEESGSFTLTNVKGLIGKAIIIRLHKKNDNNHQNIFKGIIADVGVEQVKADDTQIILKGFSPTIILEGGPHTTCYIQKDLKKICEQAAADANTECDVDVSPVYKKKISYLTQYRESNFDFLNRMSAEYGEWFFYNGKKLFFGKPSSTGSVDLTLGEDVNSLQIKLMMVPLSFKISLYDSANDSFKSYNTPEKVEIPGEYGKLAGTESDKFFNPTSHPYMRPRVTNESELSDFLKIKKTGSASQLEVINGTSTNPEVIIGTTATINVSSRGVNNIFSLREHGKYIITAVTHILDENGIYSNHFEGLPTATQIIPVTNYKKCAIEPQIGVVKDNNDPKKVGLVKVQMPWHEQNATTDWIRVMTPDGGKGGKTGKNRGFLFLPEVNDKVYIGFRFNDPDFPFVMGSFLIDGDASGGGEGNKIKTLSTNKGNTITMDDDKGSIKLEDVKGNSVLIDGAGKINVNCSEQIELKTGESSITLKKDGTILITGKMKVEVKSDQAVSIEGTQEVAIKGTNIAAKANANLDLAANANLTAKATANLELQGTAMAKFGSAAMAEITAAMVKIN
jgi:type VI secretion system secreted protein VgrG